MQFYFTQTLSVSVLRRADLLHYKQSRANHATLQTSTFTSRLTRLKDSDQGPTSKPEMRTMTVDTVARWPAPVLCSVAATSSWHGSVTVMIS